MQSPDRWNELIAACAGRKVLVVGDVILDHYLWGDVERTSPEAPVPIVRLARETATLGGATNVVANLAALGAQPLLLGVVGKDAQADTLRGLLAEINVPADGLLVDAARPTILKTRVICQNQQLLRLDREEGGGFSAALAARLVKQFGRLLRRAELVIFSDYGKGVLAPEICKALLRQARAAGKRVVIDPKGTDYTKYRGASVITPNQKEAQAATGIAIDGEKALAAAARKLQRQVQGEAVLITRGAHGAALFAQGQPAQHIPAQALAVFDVTGAGDSLISAFSLALAAGATLGEAARIGNAAGSVVVGKVGAATVSPHELLTALLPGAAGNKLRTLDRLKHELDAPRGAGKRIVFTNGCFDLLHHGHIKFLQRARRLGDLLVVAINSDASARAVKGPPRPVLTEADRAAILSSLEAVDFVVVFNELTPERLLRELKPDVLVKGRTLQGEPAVGQKIVERYGGKVELLPLLAEITTEQMVARIAGAAPAGAAARKPRKRA